MQPRQRGVRGSVAMFGAAGLICLVLVVGATLARGSAQDRDSREGTGSSAPSEVRTKVVVIDGARSIDVRWASGPWAHRLRLLDRVRSHAWSTGQPALLRDVFAPGSVALRRDRDLLAAYRSRGLTLNGVHVMYFVVRVVDRGAGWVDLRTVDRLRPEVVTHADGDGVRMPRDRRTAHLIRLSHTAAGWLIARIELR